MVRSDGTERKRGPALRAMPLTPAIARNTTALALRRGNCSEFTAQ